MSEKFQSLRRRQAADVLKRARRLPVGPDRNDLRQLRDQPAVAGPPSAARSVGDGGACCAIQQARSHGSVEQPRCLSS